MLMLLLLDNSNQLTIYVQVNYMDKMGAKSRVGTGNFTIPTCKLTNSTQEVNRLRSTVKFMDYDHGITADWSTSEMCQHHMPFTPQTCPVSKVWTTTLCIYYEFCSCTLCPIWPINIFCLAAGVV